jgi:uncharacterized protein YdaU (DUF1376 family)
VNHYPHHLGDYAKDTLGLSMLEHGAYRLLLDAYYASEEALPVDDVYAIAKAGTPAERKAVDKVLRKFRIVDGRYFHKRVEEELAAYGERAEIARTNGKKGGRKPKDKPRNNPAGNPEGNPDGTQAITRNEPTKEPERKLASNHKPENPEHRFPGDNYVGDPAEGKAVPAEPLNPEARARILVECERAQLEDPSEENAIIARWIQRFTASQVITALVDARKSMPFPKVLKAGYVDPILERIAQADERARKIAGQRERETQEQIARQRESASHAAPPPADLMAPFLRRRAG